jgi:hypothetical protein
MSFHVNAIELSSDFPNGQGFAIFSALTTDASDLDSDSRLISFCRKYFDSVANGANYFDQDSYYLEDSFSDVYINCKYKNENYPFLNINDLKFNSDPIKISNYCSFSQQVDGALSSQCSVDKYEGVLLNGYYCNFSDLGIDEERDVSIDPDKKIIISYYNARIFIFTFSDQSGTTYKRVFIVRTLKLEDPFEEDLNSINYPAIAAQLASASDTVHLEMRLYPFLLFSNTTKQIHDNDKSSLNLYPGISDTNPVVAPPVNSIYCSSTILGNVLIGVAGNPLISSQDLQICPIGGAAQVEISKVSFVYSGDVILYKDLPILSNAIQIYSYNFRYIYLLDNAGNYNLIFDAGSLQSATVNNTFDLDLSKYYSYQELEEGFKFTYKFVTSITDSSSLSPTASEYNVDVLVKARSPKITNNSFASPNATILTDYASKLVYDFNGGGASEISLTTPPDTNQSNTIDTTSQDSPLTVSAYNFFYDFDSGNRTDENKIKYSDLVKIEISTTKIIPSYKLEILRNSSAQTFYDDNSNSLTSIGLITNLAQNGFPSSIYKFYSDYSNNYDFYFKLTYSLSASISYLTMKIGERYQKLKSSPDGITLSKTDLFKFLDESSNINIIAETDDGYQFNAPFSFKNYSSNSPECSSVTVSSIKYNADSTATLTIQINYKFSDSLVVHIDGLDDENIKLPYSTSSSTYSLTKTIARGKSSVKVEATVKNIDSSGNERSARLSATATLLLKLNDTTPAVIRFFSDSGLTQELPDKAEVFKNQNIYVKFQLYDTDSNPIDVSNYPNYINTNPSPIFKLLNGGADISENVGVTLDRVNDYVYLVDISSSTLFDNVDVSIDYNLLA